MNTFEIEILSKLLISNGFASLIEVLENPEFEIEFSGTGYFITIKDTRLPMIRNILEKPDIQGELGGIKVGFLAFIEASELMLECYSYGNEIGSRHRDKGFVYNAT